MTEISYKMLQLYTGSCERFSPDLERLFQGLPIDPALVMAKSARFSWSTAVQLSNRIAEQAAGNISLEEIGRLSVQQTKASLLRNLGGFIGSARVLYWATGTWYGSMLFNHLEFRYEQRSELEYLLEVSLPKPYEDCPNFFQIITGVLQALPCYLGQPDASVELSFAPRLYRYTIRPQTTNNAQKYSIGAVRHLPRLIRGAASAIGVFADQNEQLRRQSAELSRHRQDFLRVLDGLPDGVVLHYSGEIELANRAFWSTLGGPPSEEHLPQKFQLLDLVHPDDLPRATRFIARPPHDQSEPKTAQLKFLTSSGEYTLLDLVAGAPLSFNQRTLSILTVRDISEQQKIQLQLAQVDRLASLGTLAAGVAHEINNPVTYVLGNLYMADHFVTKNLADLPIEGRANLSQMLHVAREGVERISQIVNDLKTFARDEEVELGGVDVRQVLESVLNLMRSDILREAQLDCALSPVPPVLASRARLAQLFLNLLVNALQALPKREHQLNSIRLTTSFEKGWVQVEIIDNGVGIEPKVRPHLFEPFYTTKPPGIGTGLGLAISHGIVQNLHGQIEFDTEVGKGSTFRVLLPPLESL